MTWQRLLVLVVLAATARPASAAFTLVTGTNVSVSTSGTYPNTQATSGTGLISSTNFLSWSVLGSDSVNLGSNALGPFTTSSGVTVAGVYLVSNGINPTLPGAPSTIPNTASANMQRRTSPNSFSSDFSAGEPLMFANAASAGIIIDFVTPVQAAGFRVEQDASSQRNDFFVQAFTGNNSVGYSNVFTSTNNFMDSSSPGVNSASFFGIRGGSTAETFSRIFVGFTGNAFSGPAIPFVLSTLEVQRPAIGPVDNAAPLPPTAFAGLAMIGLTVLRARRRRG